MGDTTATGHAPAEQEPTPTDPLGQEPTTDGQEQPTPTEDKPPRTPEDLEKELKATREEAKKYRLERNALRQKQDAGAKADRTEAERIESLEQEILTSRREAVAAKTGLPVDMLQGSTKEQLEESAERLNTMISERVETELEKRLQATPVMPVVAGENAGGAPLAEGDWLRNMMNTK